MGGGRRERLVEVVDDVAEMLDADADPDRLGPDSRLKLLGGLICRWVVEAGWQHSDLASPMLTSRLTSFSAS